MRRFALALAFLVSAAAGALAGEAEVRAAQQTIDSQLKAFQAGDGALAYSYAAPNIKQIFPSPEIFMGMVQQGYAPIHKPQSYGFGATEEPSPTTVVQQVTITGPDGKDYEASYRLELQPDGVFRITGVSLRAAKSLAV
ncbi:MAG TPA: DUF4864 domain-containing protein [Mesorhizobium sp.]|jgi:hypothetical protein|nr:DUF4864 domain-containing protein [Mesorhizobium sp.]